MLNRICLFFLFFTLLIESCFNSGQYKKDILGEWVCFKQTDSNNRVLSSRYFRFPSSGLKFYTDKYEDKNGFFYFNKAEVIPEKDFYLRHRKYLGNFSKYKITPDSLMMYDEIIKQWKYYKIDTLNAEKLLIISDNKEKSTFRRIKPSKSKFPYINQIILSTSGCFGTCPELSISIKDNGDVLFMGKSFTGKPGIFSSKISKATFDSLFYNFKRIDYNTLRNDYDSGSSDELTISTTFLTNNNISKTVRDYGRAAPVIFTWGYPPLENLYQKLKLTKVHLPAYLKDFEFITLCRFDKGNKVLDLEQSESFFLFMLLKNGVTITKNHKPLYTLTANYRPYHRYLIKTDGRYYSFTPLKGGKTITVDIGFNFLDRLKRSNWYKPTFYND